MQLSLVNFQWSTNTVKRWPLSVVSNLETYIFTSITTSKRLWMRQSLLEWGEYNTNSWPIVRRFNYDNNHIYWSRSYQCLVKILSQSFPWCFPGPPLPQTVQLWCCSPRPMSKSLGIWVGFFFFFRLLFHLEEKTALHWARVYNSNPALTNPHKNT